MYVKELVFLTNVSKWNIFLPTTPIPIGSIFGIFLPGPGVIISWIFTNSLTDSCCLNVMMVVEDAIAKLVGIVALADVCMERRVGDSWRLVNCLMTVYHETPLMRERLL